MTASGLEGVIINGIDPMKKLLGMIIDEVDEGADADEAAPFLARKLENKVADLEDFLKRIGQGMPAGRSPK